MQVNSPGRRPVFSYTKMSTKPPCTTVAEQNYWAHPASSIALNREKEKPPFLLKRRPKSSHSLGQGYHSEKTPRPKSSYVPKDKDICVKGDRYLQYKDQSISHDSVENLKRESRCPTPDYMKDIYDQYSDNFCEHVLLRRPLYKSLPTVLNVDKSLNFLLQDKVENADLLTLPNAKTEDNIDTATEIHSMDKSNPDILTANAMPEAEKPKLAIDITLCDSRGCLIGMEPDLLESPKSVDEELSYDVDPCAEPLEESPRPKTTGAGKSKRRPLRHNKRYKHHQNTAKRRAIELHTVAVDYTEPADNEDPRTTTSHQTENNKGLKSGDDIVTQMAALGLAKPLDDEDLRFLMQQRAVPKFQPKRKTTGRKKNCSDIESKSRPRKIPIQIISDPFKCVGSQTLPSEPAPPARQALTPRPLVRRPSSERRSRDRDTPSPKPIAKQSTFNSSKGSEDSLSSDVRLIRDKLLKVGVRLSGKKLQRCLQSPREKAHDDCVIRLRHMSSLSLLSEPKRWFEEDGD